MLVLYIQPNDLVSFLGVLRMSSGLFAATMMTCTSSSTTTTIITTTGNTAAAPCDSHCCSSALPSDRHVAAHQRDANRCAPRISHILLSVEANQQLLLVRDTAGEEAPSGGGVGQRAERVHQQQLRAHGPVEPAKVGGVPQVSIVVSESQQHCID